MTGIVRLCWRFSWLILTIGKYSVGNVSVVPVIEWRPINATAILINWRIDSPDEVKNVSVACNTIVVLQSFDLSLKSFRYTQLEPDTTYRCAVTSATTAARFQSNVVNAVTMATDRVPDPPALVSAPRFTTNSVTVQWSVDVDAFMQGVTRYSIFLNHVSTNEYNVNLHEASQNESPLSFTLQQLSPSTEYTIAIVAVNEIGASTHADVNVTTLNENCADKICVVPTCGAREQLIYFDLNTSCCSSMCQCKPGATCTDATNCGDGEQNVNGTCTALLQCTSDQFVLDNECVDNCPAFGYEPVAGSNEAGRCLHEPSCKYQLENSSTLTFKHNQVWCDNDVKNCTCVSGVPACTNVYCGPPLQTTTAALTTHHQTSAPLLSTTTFFQMTTVIGTTTHAQPVDGGFTVWSAWSGCVVNIRTRSRNCSNPYPMHGGADCEGEPIESQHCSPEDVGSTKTPSMSSTTAPPPPPLISVATTITITSDNDNTNLHSTETPPPLPPSSPSSSSPPPTTTTMRHTTTQPNGEVGRGMSSSSASKLSGAMTGMVVLVAIVVSMGVVYGGHRYYRRTRYFLWTVPQTDPDTTQSIRHDDIDNNNNTNNANTNANINANAEANTNDDNTMGNTNITTNTNGDGNVNMNTITTNTFTRNTKNSKNNNTKSTKNNKNNNTKHTKNTKNNNTNNRNTKNTNNNSITTAVINNDSVYSDVAKIHDHDHSDYDDHDDHEIHNASSNKLIAHSSSHTRTSHDLELRSSSQSYLDISPHVVSVTHINTQYQQQQQQLVDDGGVSLGEVQC